jgi:ACS family allantoate permease-like MFS transporter
MAIERIRGNQQGIGNKHFRFYQLKEALLDPMAWAFFFYAILGSISYGENIERQEQLYAYFADWFFTGVDTFFSQLIVSFGSTADESLLLGTPAGAVAVVFMIGGE